MEAMASFLLLILASCISIALGSSCGQSNVPMKIPSRNPNTRISGGVPANPNSHPWIVSLKKYGYHNCGGTLIRSKENKEESDIVLTAGHCVDQGIEGITITAGAHNFLKPTTEVTVNAVNVSIHPQYQIGPPTLNDIAILVLSEPIKFASQIQPACLPDSGDSIPDNTMAIVAGWGVTEKNTGQASDILLQVGAPIVNTNTCSNMYKQHVKIDPKIMLCAGFMDGRDACHADSGGPLIAKSANGYTLYGVVSFGPFCGTKGTPGVYARVSEFRNWIDSQVKKHSRV